MKTKWTAHFWVTLCKTLSYENEILDLHETWCSLNTFPYEWFCPKAGFVTDAEGNSEMAYYMYIYVVAYSGWAFNCLICGVNRPFVTNDHMVQNPPCWRASSLLFPHWDVKTKRPQPVKLDLAFVLMSQCRNNNGLALQHGGLIVLMWLWCCKRPIVTA